MHSYKDDGFCIVRDLVPVGDVDKVVEEIIKVIRNQAPDFGELLKKDVNLYLSSLRLCSQLVSLQTLLTHKRIREMCAWLDMQLPVFQTGPVLHIVSQGLKIPGGYFGIGPHQDYTSTNASKNGIVVWIPLVDVNADFFPLEVVPGSHRYGVFHGTQKENYFEVDGMNDKDFTPLEVKKGDVVFMSVFTVHRTGMRGREGVRMAASIRYEDANEPTFIARGYPCKYKREYVK